MAVDVIEGQGTLRSDDGKHERQCRLKITRTIIESNGQMLKYNKPHLIEINDRDNFPEGIYFLTSPYHEGERDRRRRTKEGWYLSE